MQKTTILKPITKIPKKTTKKGQDPKKSDKKNDQDTSRDEKDCKCIKIIGHLESMKKLQSPRNYRPSPGPLAVDDWTTNSFIWLHYVLSSDGILAEDDVLLSKDSRFWNIEDPQRYYVGNEHCEQVLFTYQYPYIRMPTSLGNVFWKSSIEFKTQSSVYRKELNSSLEITLKKMEAARAQVDRIILPDCLIKLDTFDYFKRQSFFQLLNKILRYCFRGLASWCIKSFPGWCHWCDAANYRQLDIFQELMVILHGSLLPFNLDEATKLTHVNIKDHLQLVSFENLCCKRLEGVSLIQHLACFNATTLKYLFLWRFVLPNENPILINYTYITGSGQYIPRPDTRHTFLRSLGELRNLRVLALEYAHIADGTGVALLSLLPVIKRPHFRLQMICRENQIPGRTDAALGGGGYDIPDTAWRRVAIACPNLYLLLAFFCIRDYDNVRRFLTPSLPLREVHLQLGIDLKIAQRQDSDISCFVRHVAYRYASTLVTLSIQQWRFVVFPLRRIFELMPHLVRLFYTGMVEDEVDLKRLFQFIACGVCRNLKQVKIQIQDEDIRKSYWREVVESLTEEYSEVMKLYNIKFCLSIYKH